LENKIWRIIPGRLTVRRKGINGIATKESMNRDDDNDDNNNNMHEITFPLPNHIVI
jgi:hypothetical protein